MKQHITVPTFTHDRLITNSLVNKVINSNVSHDDDDDLFLWYG